MMTDGTADRFPTTRWSRVALALTPGRPPGDDDEAAALARKAIEIAPKDGGWYNTPARAEYRRGHWDDSIAASERSIGSSKGIDVSNWFFLAMACARNGEKDQATEWFGEAVAWTRKNDPRDQPLLRFWTEAAGLLGRPGPGGPATGWAEPASPGDGTAPGTP